jgi:methyl-accepting chemotaxis protein/hemerythrin
MAVFSWNDSYSVKVAVCDQQHMRLFDIINKLADAMRMGKGQDVVNQVVTELLDYTNTHFQDEEALLQKANYPQLEAHREMHRIFVKKVQSLQSQAQMGKRVNAAQLLILIRDWLVNHIQKADKRYSAHLNAAGIL